jgi:hypothetical protein
MTPRRSHDQAADALLARGHHGFTVLIRLKKLRVQKWAAEVKATIGK